MNYDKLIETIKIIVNEKDFYKEGLTLVYKIDPKRHKKLSEHFHYKITKNENNDYEYTEEFEIEIANIIIKFIIDDES